MERREYLEISLSGNPSPVYWYLGAYHPDMDLLNGIGLFTLG